MRLGSFGIALVGLALVGCGQTTPTGLANQPSEPLTSLSRTGIQQASILLGQDMLRRLDADADGWVSRDEWTRAGHDPDEFKKLDLSRQNRLGINDLLRTQGFVDFKRKVNDVGAQQRERALRRDGQQVVEAQLGASQPAVPGTPAASGSIRPAN